MHGAMLLRPASKSNLAIHTVMMVSGVHRTQDADPKSTTWPVNSMEARDDA